MPSLVCNGHRIHYRIEGNGPLLLILPGSTASSANHQRDLRRFGAHYTAVAVDFWGTGRSDRIEGPWPIDWHERAAEDVAALVGYLALGPACLVGTSGGGVVALQTAITAPEVVQAVVADSCVASFREEEMRALIAGRFPPSQGQARFWRTAHGDDWEAVVQADSDMLLRRVTQREPWLVDRLHEIGCPTLLTVSLADELLPRPGEQVCSMVRQIEGSRALVLAEGGHPLIWSRPALFHAEVTRFLASTEGVGMLQGV